MNKKGVVRSYHFLVSFFQIGELSLSLGVLRPCYIPEIMLCHTPIPSPTRLAGPNRVRGAKLRTGTL